MSANTKSILDLLPEFIFGAEEEAEGTPPGNKGDDQGQSQEDAGSVSEDPKDQDPTAGLKSALAAERAAVKAANKELARLKKAQEDRDLSEKTEIEQAKTREQQANEKLEKLKTGFLTTSLNAAIRNAAAQSNFIDIEDALAGVDRSALIFEQDADDPANITIDTKSIEKAVKDLATRKPHFVKSGTTDGEATGSPSGGSRQKKTTRDEEYFANYPSLRS